MVCSHSALSDGSRLSTSAISASDRSPADSDENAGRARPRNELTPTELDMAVRRGRGVGGGKWPGLTPAGQRGTLDW